MHIYWENKLLDMKQRVCFIGLGSIATRHIKNLKDIFGEGIQIDVFRSGNGRPLDDAMKSMIGQVYYDYDSLPMNYDVMFITNPTRLHYETLQNVQEHAKHFFIEKPVFETGNEDIANLLLKNDSVYYVACPLRYTNVIQYLKENIDFSQVYSIRCISSSYLPDWRPGTDYRNTYSAKRELGGGVSIDLIHEWDYICYLVGQPQKVYSFIGRKSNLEIDSDDLAVYIAEYPDKFLELHLDYLGRKAIRKIELFAKDDSIEADLIEQKIVYRKENRIIDLNEDRDSYQKKELIHFFDIVEGKYENDNTIERACEVLRITKGE